MNGYNSNLRVAENGDILLRGNEPFFYLADTVWSAFSKITMEEWEEYLDFRRSQNFNVLQMNILPQWDRSYPDLGIHAFKVRSDGLYDYAELNEAYFKRAEKMVEMAVDRGFLPALVVLWSNFVQGTIHSQRNPANVMPLDKVAPYVTYAVSVFQKFKPLYILGGDTNYPPEAVPYYTQAAEIIRSASPEALITIHSQPIAEPPAELDKLLDVYMYQSGHDKSFAKQPYEFAREYRERGQKPVINGEPCYEGMGDAFSYGRHSRFDVRKAIWQSLLSGAKAGVTYGAHGVWSWYSEGCSCLDPYGDTPFLWRTALNFPGAWDAAFARQIFEQYKLFDLEPVYDVKDLPAEVRISLSKSSGKLAAYIPYSRDLLFELGLEGLDQDGLRFTLINLEERQFMCPRICKTEGGMLLKKPEFNSDALLLGTAL